MSNPVFNVYKVKKKIGNHLVGEYIYKVKSNNKTMAFLNKIEGSEYQLNDGTKMAKYDPIIVSVDNNKYFEFVESISTEERVKRHNEARARGYIDV